MPGIPSAKTALRHTPYWRNVLVITITVLVVLILPPAIYAYLSYAQFGVFKPSYFIPYEAFFFAIETGWLEGVWNSPLIIVNMTSGLLLSNMYSLSLGQLILSVALGVVIALNLIAHAALRRTCPARTRVGETAGATSTGLFATVAASSTGIFGCCGSALSGGVLALAGLSSTTAAQIADWSPYVQVALIALFTLNYFRLRRRTQPRQLSDVHVSGGRLA